MMEKEIISSRQFMIITLLFSIGTAILIIPASVTSEAKQDAWIAAIIGVILSLPVIKLFVTLGNKTPTLTFVEANEKILGRFFGKFTAIGFVLICLLSAGELLYFIGIFMKTEIMPETPTMAFAFMFSIIIIYAAFLGIEVFARSAEVICPIFIIIFIFFVLFISPSIQIENIQPIMETPTHSLFFSMIRFISLFSFPLAVLLTIFPSAVNVQKSAQNGFYIGTIIGGIVLITIIALSILVLGPANTASRTFPSYSLAQRISIGNFLQRIEVIMATMWIISIYIRTFMYFYAAVIGISQLCKIKNHRPLIFPLGMIILGLSQIVHPNIIHSDIYNRDIWPVFSFTIMILLPLILLLVAKIRKIDDNQGSTSACSNSTQNENSNTNGITSQSAGSSNSNNDNSTQNASNHNGGNPSQSGSNDNSGNASQSTNSNNDNAAQSASNNNNGNASQSASNNNNGNASQSASNNNNGNASQSASNNNNGNASQSASNNNGGNPSQSASNNNNGNASQSTSSNNDNSAQCSSNNNDGNASQSTYSNNENASQSTSSNNDDAAQSASNNNNENASQSTSNNNENAAQSTSNSSTDENTTQDDSDTGNTPNSDKNKDSSEN